MKKIREILFLKSIKGIGKTTIYKKYWSLLNDCKNLDELMDGVRKHNTNFTDDDLREAQVKADLIISNLEKMSDIQAITVFDKEYPARLQVMNEKRPLILYVKGDIHSLDGDTIALIGTRKPSDWSQKIEVQLTRKILELSDRVIISGLALGCDAIAQKATVEAGRKTVAVLPSGVNCIVPASHKSLAVAILDQGGCLLSEYEPDMQAFKKTFVERDAIVAALSDITFAVECGVDSGTMHTVNAAYDYNKTIACYYPKDFAKGEYLGNLYMAVEKRAVKVSNTEELYQLLAMREQ